MPSTTLTNEQKERARKSASSLRTGDARVAAELVYMALIEQQGASFETAEGAAMTVGRYLDGYRPSCLIPAAIAAGVGFLIGYQMKARK